jgi:hypothetical protein
VIIHFCHLLPVTGSSIAYGRNVYSIIFNRQLARAGKKRGIIKKNYHEAEVNGKRKKRRQRTS